MRDLNYLISLEQAKHEIEESLMTLSFDSLIEAFNSIYDNVLNASASEEKKHLRLANLATYYRAAFEVEDEKFHGD